MGFVDWLGDLPVWRSGAISRDRIIVNPNFEINPGVYVRHNIALLDLRASSPIPESPYVRTISLPSVSDGSLNLVGRVGTVSGFGVDITGSPSQVLNALDLIVMDSSNCNPEPNFFHPGHICTANPGNTMFCLGDSGKIFSSISQGLFVTYVTLKINF